MRTTIDLPDDLHRLASDIARDRKQTLGQAVAFLMERGLTRVDDVNLSRSKVTGLLVMRGSGKPITHEDVRSLEDDK